MCYIYMRDRGSLRSPLSALRSPRERSAHVGAWSPPPPPPRSPDARPHQRACGLLPRRPYPASKGRTSDCTLGFSALHRASGAFRWRASVRVYSVLGSGVRFCVRGSRAMPLWPAAGVRGAPSWYAVVFLSCQPSALLRRFLGGHVCELDH
jgi:hypothetical protein